MNTVSLRKVQRELGRGSWRQLEELAAFMFAETLPPSRRDKSWLNAIPRVARCAQSIITRSEVELFCMSVPRFAYRLYFPDSDLSESKSCLSFANCRRLEVFKRELGRDPRACLVERNQLLTQKEKHPDILCGIPISSYDKLLQIRDEQEVIADCLLQPPERYSRIDYHIITADLYRQYGEIRSTHPPGDNLLRPKGTPFVKTISLGGGLCAQACCFMATAILHEFAKGVFGLGDITALAIGRNMKEMLISGLLESEMIAYFREVELNAILQFTNPNITSLLYRQQLNQTLNQTLHAYVQSEIPVILLVDAARLGRIYKSNSYQTTILPGIQRHAVVVVGCSRWESWGDSNSPHFKIPSGSESSFLFMDPSSMPFMRATLEQLADIGVARKRNIDQGLLHPAILPVTPPQVKMPLLCWGKTEVGGWRYGLLEISKYHALPRIHETDREFCLSKICKKHFPKIASHFGTGEAEEAAYIINELLPRVTSVNLGWEKDHYVWLEWGRNVLKVWDAELEPIEGPDPQNPAHYLRAVVEFVDCAPCLKIITPAGKLIPITVPSRPQRRILERRTIATSSKGLVQQERLLANSTLQKSLISSFTVRGANRAAKLWPSQAGGGPAVEFYCCMQEDIHKFFKWETLRKRVMQMSTHSAVQILASQNDKVGAAQRFAKSIQGAFSSLDMVAFATFIPEIMSPHEPSYKDAQKALKFIIRTAHHLKKSDRPFVIEFVGGSRMHGLWCGEMRDGGQAFVVNRLAPAKALEILLKRLEPVAAAACQCPGILLALELEPGPLFNLGDRDQLLELCKVLVSKSTDCNLRRVVGVNLDIAHWAFLSGISVDWLVMEPESQKISSRIVHAHVSDHDKGHFCDNPIGLFHPLGEFRKWIDFIERVWRQRDPLMQPQFSGAISCEMEACKEMDFVTDSLKVL